MGRRFDADFWNVRYRGSGRVWSDRPNPHLLSEVAALTAGRAADLGCGEGSDAIWLARTGWRVDAVDFSSVALERVTASAAQAGAEIAGRITTVEADLAEWTPPSDRYDLVCAQFLHIPADLRASMIRRVAAAVRPGGSLLLIGHDRSDLTTDVSRPGRRELYFTGADMFSLVDPHEWSMQTDQVVAREGVDRDGSPATVHDVVVHLRRRSTFVRNPVSCSDAI